MLPPSARTHSQASLLGGSWAGISVTLARLLNSSPGGSSAASSLRLGEAGPLAMGLGPVKNHRDKYSSTSQGCHAVQCLLFRDREPCPGLLFSSDLIWELREEGMAGLLAAGPTSGLKSLAPGQRLMWHNCCPCSEGEAFPLQPWENPGVLATSAYGASPS